MAVSKQNSAAAHETTPRHVWLAGLGLVAIARREAIAGAQRARGELDALRSRVEPGLARFGAEVESRLAPMLARLGLAPSATARRARPAATKKTTRRAGARAPRRVARGAMR